MKIAVLKKYYNPEGGGAEKYAAAICEGLVWREHEIYVFAEEFKAPLNSGIKHVPVKKSFFGAFSGTEAFHNSVQKELKASEFDVVYALARTYPADVFRVSEQIHAEWMKINYPSWQRFNPRHSGIIKLERKIFEAENTRAIITNSALTKKQIIDLFDYPEDKIIHIRNGVDRKEFFPPKNEKEIREFREKLDLGEENLVLLFVAGNFEIKGLENAINTVAKLDSELRKKIRLLVVGNDSDKARFIRQAEKLSLSGNIRFEGKKNRLREYYIASDLLFHPTLYEPFANVCLEACACGLPVLTTEMNGAAEMIDVTNGFIVSDASCESQMAGCIAKFAEFPPEKRAKFAASAYKASLIYDWNKHLDSLEKLFIDLKS